LQIAEGIAGFAQYDATKDITLISKKRNRHGTRATDEADDKLFMLPQHIENGT